MKEKKSKKTRQVCVTIDEELYQEFKKASKEIGMPISQIVRLRLKGFHAVKVRVKSQE